MSEKPPARRWTARRLARALAITVAVWLALSWVSAWVVVHPITFRAGPAPLVEGVQGRDITFTASDGVELSGWWFGVEDPRGSVVLCHGAFESRLALRDRLPPLLGSRCNVLLFDCRGRGRSGGGQSTIGELETDDVLGAADWTLTREPSVPVAVLGYSMGAAAGLMAAARDPRIAAVIADSSYASLDRAEGRHLRTFLGPLAGALGGPCRWFGRRMIGFELSSVRPIDEIAGIAPRPILLIHGEGDFMTDPQDSRMLQRAAGRNAELWLVPGARHTKARLKAPEEYWRRVTSFLTTVLDEAAEAGEL